MGAIVPTSRIRAAVRLLVTAALACAANLALPAPATADWVRNDQWQVRELNARDAWKLATGQGVIVAVLDSGVDARHPDLAGQVLPGADFVDGSTDARTDPVGHGTTVAGLIAGRSDDGDGVVGVAPETKILPVRVLDRDNKYDDPAIVAKGLRWAVDSGASVINLSLGGHVRSDVLADALRYAAERDVVVIACTGNITGEESSREVWYPAREPGVIAVAGLVRSGSATGRSSGGVLATTGGGSGGGVGEALWSGSLTGPETVLAAPAVNLQGARPGGGYWQVQGTSFAAPLVAAAASLVRSRYPRMSAANVVNRLIRTAHDLGPAGRDSQYGYGEVNPLEALRADLPEVAINPLDSSARPAGGFSTRSLPQTEADSATDGPSLRISSPNSPARALGSSASIGLLVTATLFTLGVVVWRRRHS